VQVRRKQKIDKYFGYLLITLLLPFTRLLGITMRRDHSTQTAPRRILFIKLMGLGSLVVASDALAALKARWPETRFTLLTDDNIAAGAAPFGLFDEIYPVRTDNLWATFTSMIGFLGRSWQWRRLWVIDLEVYSKLTTVLALLTGARNRFGFYLSLVPFRKYLNTLHIRFDQSAFLEDNYHYLIREVAGGEIELPVPPVREAEYDKPYILVNNTCSGLAYVRKLPEPAFLQICQWILQHTHYGLAVLGGPEDGEDIRRFIENDPVLARNSDRIVNVAGTIRDFGSYYRFLQEKGVCLVTIDSGPLHMARKLGLPTVSVWGPTDPNNYLKVSAREEGRHLVQYLGIACSPCVHRYEKLPCGGNNSCMKEITAAAVIARIKELLDRLASPRRLSAPAVSSPHPV